jgi:hypothetical protein
MKTTKYFEYTRKRPDRSGIKDEWITKAIESPIESTKQSDGRLKKWSYIEEVARYLRVILLEDGETVHSAFFDRSFKPGAKS